MSNPLPDRVNQASELLAAASTATTDEARVLYLAAARNVIVDVEAALAIAKRGLERLEEELARKPYAAKEEKS